MFSMRRPLSNCRIQSGDTRRSDSFREAHEHQVTFPEAGSQLDSRRAIGHDPGIPRFRLHPVASGASFR